MFIETSCEKRLHKLFIPKSLSYNFSNKIEILDDVESAMYFESVFVRLIGISAGR